MINTFKVFKKNAGFWVLKLKFELKRQNREFYFCEIKVSFLGKIRKLYTLFCIFSAPEFISRNSHLHTYPFDTG